MFIPGLLCKFPKILISEYYDVLYLYQARRKQIHIGGGAEPYVCDQNEFFNM